MIFFPRNRFVIIFFVVFVLECVAVAGWLAHTLTKTLICTKRSICKSSYTLYVYKHFMGTAHTKQRQQQEEKKTKNSRAVAAATTPSSSVSTRSGSILNYMCFNFPLRPLLHSFVHSKDDRKKHTNLLPSRESLYSFFEF